MASSMSIVSCLYGEPKAGQDETHHSLFHPWRERTDLLVYGIVINKRMGSREKGYGARLGMVLRCTGGEKVRDATRADISWKALAIDALT